MSPFQLQADLKIVSLPGALRVAVRPAEHWLGRAMEAAGIVLFAAIAFHEWTVMSILLRNLMLTAALVALVARLYEVSGSEVIEFRPDKLIIHKRVLGRRSISEYNLSACSELQWRQQTRGDENGLQCNVGLTSIRFGRYLSKEQVSAILTALEEDLPQVAGRLACHPARTGNRD